MASEHVILAGPDDEQRAAIAAAFRSLGLHVIPLDDARLAGEALATADARYLVMDLNLAGVERASLLLASEVGPGMEPLEVMERRHIDGVLRHTGGNRTRAARMLGISRSTLLAKIRRYGLT